MEIKPTITEAQKREFENPFPTPKGQVVQDHYAFFIPEDRRDVMDELVKALTGADMNVKLFAVDGGVSVKAKFRTYMLYAQAEPILLPILQRLDIPQFTSIGGDITTIDNQGDLISWISSDFIEMCEEDDDEEDDEA